MFPTRKLAGAALTASLIAMGGLGTTVASAGAARAATCPAASQIVTQINAAAAQVAGLNSVLAGVTDGSSATAVLGAAQSVVTTVSTLAAGVVANAGALAGCAPLGVADSQAVAAAFANLTGATGLPLAALVQDHSAFAQFGQTLPLAAALQSLETSVDLYATTLAATVAPSQAATIQGAVTQVNSLLSNTVNVYQQVCIPSPLYPIVKPLCFGA